MHIKCKHSGEQSPSSGGTICFQEKRDESAAQVEVPSSSGERFDSGTNMIEKRRGSQHRTSRTNLFRSKVIELHESGRTPNEILELFPGIALSQKSKWMKDGAKIMKAAAGEHKTMLKTRPTRKYNRLYSELIQKFSAARKQGRRINFDRIWSKARKISHEALHEDTVIRKHVIVNFIKRYHLKLRRTQRNKKIPKESLHSDLQRWHSTTRERLVRTGVLDNYHPKWGHFLPAQRFNVDQSPLPFAIDVKRTYEQIIPGSKENQNKKIWVSQPFSGANKRQCSLNICFRPDGNQPRIAVIFRGQGISISDAEKQAWDKDVDVYFQKCAWADQKFCIDFIERTLKPVVEKESRFVLFCDNLTCQNTPVFRESIAKLNGVVWYGLKNAIDLWQPVDAGYTEKLKAMIKHSFFDWLDDDDNADSWYGVAKFTSSERRILLTH